jgi:hypothetical protein
MSKPWNQPFTLPSFIKAINAKQVAVGHQAVIIDGRDVMTGRAGVRQALRHARQMGNEDRISVAKISDQLIADVNSGVYKVTDRG